MRAIDGDALIANQFKNDISYKAFVNLVKRQPTIEPERKEIIYCKDCKHYHTSDCYIHIERLWELKPTDYCSQAERK